MAVVWFVLSAVGLLWPSRILGPLDGAPLAGALEPVCFGLLFPFLSIARPSVFKQPRTRAVVLTLLLWKLVAPLLFTQQGWTGTFWLSTSAVRVGATTLERQNAFGGPLPRAPWIRSQPPTWPTDPQLSWDVRAWSSGTTPRVSAIVDRPYPTMTSFPAWFLNLLDDGRPPGPPFTFDVDGYLSVDDPGTLSFERTDGDDVDITIDSHPPSRSETGDVVTLAVAPGRHHVRIHFVFRGNAWRFVPLWNGRDLWTSACTTVDPPSRIDLTLWRGARWVTTTLVVLFFAGWLAELFSTRRIDLPVIAWVAGASGAMAMAAQWETLARFSPLLLFGSVMLPLDQRRRTIRGALFLIGIPWLAFIASHIQFQAGHFTLYSLGDDWMRFQRFAHRVYMEGYWLEGGEPTFWWQQPLYRWMIAALHLIFGDSSIGESYWDGACLLVSALFTCHVVKAVAGFRWGLVAASMTLVTFTLSPIWWVIGRGLSEIAAAGWVYLAALCLLRSRLGASRWTLAAAFLATLAFYTRLNHLPFLLTCLVLVFPRHPSAWRASARRTVLIGATYVAGLGFGTCVFALRTWYYTGVFSILYGTQRGHLSTTLGVTTIFSRDAWQRALASVWTVITIQEPGRLNLRALVVTCGVALAGLSVLRLPYARRVPLALAIVCWGGLLAPLMVKSEAYAGRLSVHLVPVAVAISVIAVALSVGSWSKLNQRRTARAVSDS